ncbi:hypothetical protein NLI96_g6745 [Meripilus lineatus]|uniref:Blue (type 1) copper domain-containing protein n=1 Tax=Meripilus lineatus TaxID=2056292 RepID=A0AAD5V5P6_9APHY|nr:hypothetical protein NLI96_g6745 [Physisporinus lineatus]
MFVSALALSLLPVVALANPQYGGYGGGGSSPSSSAAASAAAASTSADAGRTIVNVGQGGLVFSPSNVVAAKGTFVTFRFPSAPHSVTQSTFVNPCTPLTGNGTGFDSGITTGTEFTVQVEDDTKPIWFFCKVQGHCGNGMVGSINAPSTGNTFDNFQAAAKALGTSAPTVTNTGVVTGGVGAVATSGPTSAAANASAAPSPSTSQKPSSAGRIAVSGGLGLIAAAVAFGVLA